MKLSKMILALVLALSLLFSPLSFGRDATKANADSQKKATQMTNTKKQAAPKELQEPGKKKQTELKAKTIIPEDDKSTAQIKLVEPQDLQPPFASAVWDKGRQIKWQILSSGGGCGSSTRAYWVGVLDGCILCGTVGQLAVGPGSSESFGVNSGFWQEDGEGFLRGDCNRDGVIDLGDVLYIVSYLYKGGPAPDPLWTGDCNCDEAIDLGDLLHLVAYLYKGGPAPGCP